VNLTLQTLLGSVGLLRGDHVDETKTARLLSVGVAHDVALLNFAVLLEKTCDFIFGQARMNASDEEVGALVTALVSFTVARLRWRATAVTAVGGGTAGARIVIVTDVAAR
jgi:hypothetical protein